MVVVMVSISKLVRWVALLSTLSVLGCGDSSSDDPDDDALTNTDDGDATDTASDTDADAMGSDGASDGQTDASGANETDGATDANAETDPGGDGATDADDTTATDAAATDSAATDAAATDSAATDSASTDAAGTDSADPGTDPTDTTTDPGPDEFGDLPAEEGLIVRGNAILELPFENRFHGRGANFTDTRSCNACTYLDPDVEGLNRWADELLDVWGANFVRLTLTAFEGDDGYRRQWASLVDDADYAEDVVNTVTHMTSKEGVYVQVTLFTDPALVDNNDQYDSEWPTEEALPIYELLAELFADNRKVLFGLTNEPHGPVENNPELAQRYVEAIDAIRAVETSIGVDEHVVVVQAPQQWARDLSWFVDNPIDRSNVAYEVHPYNPQEDFEALLTEPSATLPLIVGEYGPTAYSDEDDIRALWVLAQELEIPHMAWIFHHRCPPNLLDDTAEDGCGLSADSGYDFPRTEWGDMLYDYLQTEW